MLTVLRNETLKPQTYRWCVEGNRTHILHSFRWIIIT